MLLSLWGGTSDTNCFSLVLFSCCSVSQNQSDPWTPGGSTTAVRGLARRWSRSESRLHSPSLSQTWISMHWRGRWGAKREAEMSKQQRQKGLCAPSQRGWWPDCVLQGSADLPFYLYCCVYFSCIFIFLYSVERKRSIWGTRTVEINLGTVRVDHKNSSQSATGGWGGRFHLARLIKEKPEVTLDDDLHRPQMELHKWLKVISRNHFSGCLRHIEAHLKYLFKKSRQMII